MKGNRAVLTAIIVLAVIIAGWWVFRRGATQSVDLLALYPQAKKDGAPWTIADVTLAGDTKHAISAPANGRLHFKVRVPEDGWLKVSLGMLPASWDKEGDGVYFFVGVSDGKNFDEIFTQTVNPYQNQSERRWVDVSADLSSYSGEEVELVFNTRASGPGVDHADDRNDLPVWGAPRLVTR